MYRTQDSGRHSSNRQQHASALQLSERLPGSPWIPSDLRSVMRNTIFIIRVLGAGVTPSTLLLSTGNPLCHILASRFNGSIARGERAEESHGSLTASRLHNYLQAMEMM